MAGQRETFGNETEEEWVKRMSQPGALAPARNIAGFKKAVGAGRPSLIQRILERPNDIELPDMDFSWLKKLFRKKSLASEIAKKKKDGVY